MLVFGDLIDFGKERIPALGGGFVVEGNGFGLFIPLPFAVVGFVEVEDLEEGLAVEIILGPNFFDVRQLGFEAGVEALDRLLEFVVRNAFGAKVLGEEDGAVGKAS